MAAQPGSAGEVFGVFLRLGLTSFGGPIAHLAYFREEFVARRRWLDERQFSQLLALCQFLPGPASSQLGFATGLMRAGWRGALAAFVAFTTPSALLLFLLAGATAWFEAGAGAQVAHGLKLVAVAVVAHGVLGMARQLAPDLQRAAIAATACAVVLLSRSAAGQLLVIALGAIAGYAACRHVAPTPGTGLPVRHGQRAAIGLLLAFALLLAAAFVLSDSPASLPGLAAAFYQAGALVFGGGHVVLPLLEEAVVQPGWISADQFLAGYGAAQAVPGPMFTLAAFLGGLVDTGYPTAVGALVALGAVFAPGFLLLLAVLPLWGRLTAQPGLAAAFAGVNAAVVGLLAAALYDPLWTAGIHSPTDVAIALGGFALLAGLRRSSVWVIAWCVAATLLAHAVGLAP